MNDRQHIHELYTITKLKVGDMKPPLEKYHL